jgi:hypothetical protein
VSDQQRMIFELQNLVSEMRKLNRAMDEVKQLLVAIEYNTGA